MVSAAQLVVIALVCCPWLSQAACVDEMGVCVDGLNDEASLLQLEKMITQHAAERNGTPVDWKAKLDAMPSNLDNGMATSAYQANMAKVRTPIPENDAREIAFEDEVDQQRKEDYHKAKEEVQAQDVLAQAAYEENANKVQEAAAHARAVTNSAIDAVNEAKENYEAHAIKTNRAEDAAIVGSLEGSQKAWHEADGARDKAAEQKAKEADKLQSAKADEDASTQSYAWPSARGSVGNYGVSQFPAIRNISVTPTWNWESTKGRWANIPNGICIDDSKHIYLTLADGIRKFSPDGNALWKYNRISKTEQISDGGSLWNAAVYGITTAARVFAVSMETGTEIWSTITGQSKTLNYGQTAAHDGVVIVASISKAAALSKATGADDIITGLDATDGSILWTFTPDVPVWNFAASFVGDGTFIYQDLNGKAHRNYVSNGTLVWKAGGVPGSWTDGQATVGPNGIVYSVSNYGPPNDKSIYGPPDGFIAAHRLTDGKLLWKQDTVKPPNDVPVVAKLFGKTTYSVVLPGGQQTVQGQTIYVHAFDAETGTPQWTFTGPAQKGKYVAGDAEGVSARKANDIRTMTAPNPWGQAAVDKDGTVYIGGETGQFFSLRDANGDGTVDPNDSNEVYVFETGAAFVGSSGPAIAPGLLAAAAEDRLHVWRWPTSTATAAATAKATATGKATATATATATAATAKATATATATD